MLPCKFWIGKSRYQMHMQPLVFLARSQRMQLFREEKIELDALKALTLSDDPKKQRAALQHCDGYVSAHRIKQFLKTNTINALDKRVLLVGLEAYTAAGGAITRSLLSDDDTMLHDEAVLDQLYSAIIEGHRKIWLDKGWSNISTDNDPDYDEAATYSGKYRQNYGQVCAPTAAEAKRLAEINTTLEDRELDEAALAEIRRGHAKTTSAIEARAIWSDDVIKNGTVFIRVDYDCDVIISAGWVKRESQKTKVKADEKKPIYGQAHENDLAQTRTGIIQLALLDQNKLSNDIAAFNLAIGAEKYLNHKYLTEIGTIKIDARPGRNEKEDHPLYSKLNKLERSWLDGKGTNERFAAFRQLSPSQKQAWTTLAVASSLSVNLKEGWQFGKWHFNIPHPCF